jgi:hypothetical protein
VRNVVLEIGSRLRIRSPVDTGRFRLELVLFPRRSV